MMLSCSVVLEPLDLLHTCLDSFHTIGHETTQIHKMVVYYEMRTNSTIKLTPNSHFVNYFLTDSFLI